MIHKIIVLIFLQAPFILAAPLQLPLLQPLQGTLQQQELALQEQMFAIQQFQALQRFNAVPPPALMNLQQPLLLLFPNTPSNTEPDERYTKLNEDLLKSKPSLATEDEDSDSITIDAEPQDTIDTVYSKNTPMRAILLVPNNARFSLGDFISNVPFLPFEINVPDSISWIYNGISGIISGIGQSWPFTRPQSSENQSGINIKSVWKDWKTKKLMPIIVMPLGQPMVPMQM